MPIAEFAYNNTTNTSTDYTPFKLNCGFYRKISYEEDVDPQSKSKTVKQLVTELQSLISMCRENLYDAQELQKSYHNKHTKPKSYAVGDIVWLNSKYIKTKQSYKFQFKFFGLFWVLHLVEKQAYKLELPQR